MNIFAQRRNQLMDKLEDHSYALFFLLLTTGRESLSYIFYNYENRGTERWSDAIHGHRDS